MNDCPNGEMRDLLPDLLHGRLEGAEREAVAAHVAACADCRAELALLTQMRGTLRRTPTVSVDSLVSAIGRAPDSRMHASRPAAGRSWGGWRAAAAITAIALGGTSIAIARREPAVTPPVIATAPVVVAPPAPVAMPAQRPATIASASIPAPRSTSARAPHEIAVSGAVSDLSDRELAALLRDIGTLDVLPSADVDGGALAPATGVDDTGEVL